MLISSLSLLICCHLGVYLSGGGSYMEIWIANIIPWYQYALSNREPVGATKSLPNYMTIIKHKTIYFLYLGLHSPFFWTMQLFLPPFSGCRFQINNAEREHPHHPHLRFLVCKGGGLIGVLHFRCRKFDCICSCLVLLSPRLCCRDVSLWRMWIELMALMARRDR